MRGGVREAIAIYIVSYSTVVLYIGIMKVRGFWPKILSSKNQLDIYFLTL